MSKITTTFNQSVLLARIFQVVCLAFFSLFFALQASAQLNQMGDFVAYDFSVVDAKAKRLPKNIPPTPEKLANYLGQIGSNEVEKVRACYVWLTHNVQYDMAALKKKKRINQSNQQIMERGKAVCWGYATFFKAMCDQIGITAAVISGYSKGTVTQTSDLSEIDHAWNGVKINGKWYLLDVTWGAGYVVGKTDYVRYYSDDYFLPPAAFFLVKHLPADPVWQLLSCPISPSDFQDIDAAILQLAQRKESCYALQDSLRAWELRPSELRPLHDAFNAYAFHPTPFTKELVGHSLMDYEFHLSKAGEQLRDRDDQIDALLAIQQKIIDNALLAQAHIDLYDRHKENLGYTYLNYATTLSRKTPPLEIQGDYGGILAIYEQMYVYLQKGKAILQALPTNFHIQQALNQCEDTLEVIAHNRLIFETR